MTLNYQATKATTTLKTQEFPCLMEDIYNGWVVLVTGPYEGKSTQVNGLVVADPNKFWSLPYKVGQFMENITSIHNLRPYNGTVTITSE